MPFDNTKLAEAISLKGSVDASKMTPRERLECLRDFLRTDVPNVAWNYAAVSVKPECGTAGCAMGWWAHLTGAWSVPSDARLKIEFGIDGETLDQFFYGDGMGKRMAYVTPTDVADAIDAYLARQTTGTRSAG